MSLNNQLDSRLFSVPNFVSWFYPKRIWSKMNSDAVYLTFDDGPHPETTPWLLDLFKAESIKATFFFIGEQAEKYPDLLSRVKAEGHALGHHGYSHISPKKQDLKEFQANFEKSKSLINSELYRPPHGDIKRTQAKYALENGKLVMWSWMSYDWDNKLPVQNILDRFKKDVKKGDIAVFHENEKSKDRVKQIIPEIISIVRKKGLNFAALET